MNTNTNSRFSQTLARYKALPKGKMIAVSIAGVIITLFIILVVVDAVSPRINVLFGKNDETENVNPNVYDISKDDFDPATFTSATAIENGPGDTVITVNYPVTATEKLDEAIQASIKAFAAKVSENATSNETYTAKPFAYDNYVFVTVANDNITTSAIPVATYGFTKRGALTKSIFEKEGYEDAVVNYVGQELSKGFQTSLETAAAVTKTALTAKNYRLASNGLVVQLPSAAVGAQNIGASFYEVLVPNAVLAEFLDN